MRTSSGVLVAPLCAALLLGSACRETSTQRASPKQVPLPSPATRGTMSLEEALAKRRSVRQFAGTALTWEEMGQLAWAAQGITDPTTGHRTAPSAGALYPLELYLATRDGLYHYVPDGHVLEQLSDRDPRLGLQAAALNQGAIGQAPCVLVIAGVYERTAGKYGDRAQRYVHMEAGHAGQNVQLQAVALGLGSVVIGGLPDEAVQAALALPQDHRPLYIIPVGHAAAEPR